MQTRLVPPFRDSDDGRRAEAIVRKCVHCGLCNATCPTYQLLGDERDGPRGRIYQIKQLLEGAPVTRATQLHLDRCLTCRSCETTCPAGVEYGSLLDIGRRLVDERVPRTAGERLARSALKHGLTSAWFSPAVALGRRFAPLLPRALRRTLGAAPTAARAAPAARSQPRVLVLAGCVQPALRPSIGRATLAVLEAAGLSPQAVGLGGCCGALATHLGDGARGTAQARALIDAWWPAIEAGGIEAIVADASACALAIKDYGHALAGDPAYASRAARVSALARDLSELLPAITARLSARIRPPASERFAFHAPCTLQHGQRLRDAVAPALARLGFALTGPCADAHLCCGSAGTYSLLQPALSRALRERKLDALLAERPTAILSANIGCVTHLQGGTALPVRHWIEVLAEALQPAPATAA